MYIFSLRTKCAFIRLDYLTCAHDDQRLLRILYICGFTAPTEFRSWKKETLYSQYVFHTSVITVLVLMDGIIHRQQNNILNGAKAISSGNSKSGDLNFVYQTFADSFFIRKWQQNIDTSLFRVDLVQYYRTHVCLFVLDTHL